MDDIDWLLEHPSTIIGTTIHITSGRPIAEENAKRKNAMKKKPIVNTE